MDIQEELASADTYVVISSDGTNTHLHTMGHTPLVLELLGDVVYSLVDRGEVTLGQALKEIFDVVQERERWS